MVAWLPSSHNIKSTTKIQNHHHSGLAEIELNGSLTTTELKKPHPCRLVGEVQTWNGLVAHCIDKNARGICWEGGVPDTQPVLPAQGSRARKISPHNFWLQTPAGIESVEETAGAPSSFSQRTHTRTNSLRLTPSELQHWDSSSKGTRDTQGKPEVFGIKESRGHCPFAKLSPLRASKLVPYLRLQQPG